MSLETPFTTPENTSEGKSEQIHRVVERFRVLEAAEPEAAELLLHGRPVTSDAEREVAACKLMKDSCAGEAEACGQRGEPYAERAARMLEQMLDAERIIVGLGRDAERDSDELAALIQGRHPALFESANDSSFEQKDAA